jgi:hypothetical protein
MYFTEDELFLISIYDTGDREGTIDEISGIRQYLEEDETSLAELMESVLKKLRELSDEDYLELDLIPDYLL